MSLLGCAGDHEGPRRSNPRLLAPTTGRSDGKAFHQIAIDIKRAQKPCFVAPRLRTDPRERPLFDEEGNLKHVVIPPKPLLSEGTRIERTFKFANFKEALEFVDQIGALAEAEGHHPDIRFGWGDCTVELYAHKIKGLHQNDFIMAAKIDELARA
jgi:4a-hydroxytetrahydrobiopterin dehydratase